MPWYVPAYGMVLLPENPSARNGQIPGCSFILSVGCRGSMLGLTAHSGQEYFTCNEVEEELRRGNEHEERMLDEEVRRMKEEAV